MKPSIGLREYFNSRFSQINSDSIYFNFENIFFASCFYRLIPDGDDYHPLYDAGGCEILLPLSMEPEDVRAVMKKHQISMAYIPEEYIDPFMGTDFRISEVSGLHNYIYRTSDLAGMHGSGYESQRRNINYFKKHYSFELEEISGNNIECLYPVLNRWEREYNSRNPGDTSDYLNQFVPLYYFFELGLNGVLVSIDDVPEGFAFGYTLNRDVFIGYSIKSDRKFKGLNEFMLQELNQRNSGKQFFNYCEDCGLPGLAETKRRLNPVKILKMYTVEFP